MKKEEFYAWAARNGWEKDRHGHVHKGDQRFKVQATSVRLERSYQTTATEYSKSEKRWIKLSSAYFKNLSLAEGDKLAGLKK